MLFHKLYAQWFIPTRWFTSKALERCRTGGSVRAVPLTAAIQPIRPGGMQHRSGTLRGALCLLLLLVVTGCAAPGSAPTVSSMKQMGSNPTNATATAVASNASMAHFTFSGGQNASYTLHTNTPASQLRHGHREFTILLKDMGVSLFLVFYGYEGPGHYTLKDSTNGGDVHIGLEYDTISWDLLMQPTAHCDLTVSRDIPTSTPGLDRMRGSFTCPLLLSSSPSKPQNPVQVSEGSFDIAMLVAS